MASGASSHGEPGGPIAYMASNSVAANLLMVGILVAGVASLFKLELEAWPTVPFNQVEVSVAYPGATPEEVEEGIVAKIEDEVEGLGDVKAVKSVAAPGMGSVRVEMRSGTDMNNALADVEAAVGRIQTFPGEAERPQIREMTNAQSVMRLIVYGDVSERALKELAYRVEDELAALPSVSQVETSGVRNYEISIEVPLQRLRALGLTLTDIANTIRRSSLDLSAGSIDTERSQVRVRTLGQSYDQQDFEGIVILSRGDGTVVRLGDIAEVHDGFQATDLIVRHQGLPAVFVEVSRADGEKVMSVARAVRSHVADEIAPSLPDGVGITIWNDESDAFEERAAILIKNGLLGLLLVLIALGMFLELRLAFWVAVGFGVSGIGALAVMFAFDMAIHAVSLFSFVLAIGIVVDDAIVVSEHIHLERMKGTPGVIAAIRGARRIKVPLIFAVLTTVAAFAPLLFIPGGVGQTWKALPTIVIAMLVISLIESLLVLPNHLSHHLHGPDWAPRTRPERFVARIQARVDTLLGRFLQGPLHRGVSFATDRPGLTLSAAVALLILCGAMLPAGIVSFTFATEVEGDFANATLEMPGRDDGRANLRGGPGTGGGRPPGHRTDLRRPAPRCASPAFRRHDYRRSTAADRRRGTESQPQPEPGAQCRHHRVQAPGRAAPADSHRRCRAGVARGSGRPASCSLDRHQRHDLRLGQPRRGRAVASGAGAPPRDRNCGSGWPPRGWGHPRHSLRCHTRHPGDPARTEARGADAGCHP